MTGRLFVDMDGVLADFDGHYLARFGAVIGRHAPEPPDLWANIATRPDWFAELPLMPGALGLWRALEPWGPILLSGVSTKIPDVHAQKRRWADRHLGGEVPLITTRDKPPHGAPGDVLLDDWARWRGPWVRMGGLFVLHDPRDPAASAEAVRALLGPPEGRA